MANETRSGDPPRGDHRPELSRTAAQRLFRGRTDDTRLQFLRYLFVGGLAAAVDTGCLYALHAYLAVNHLVAAAVGFCLGLVANYLLSIAWVFESTGRIKEEFALFALIGVGGLAWTELILWVGVDRAGAPVLAAKAVALALVLVWNFWMRKRLVFARGAGRRRPLAGRAAS